MLPSHLPSWHVGAAHVVAIRRSTGQTIYHPRSDLELRAGDIAVLVGKTGAAAALQKLKL